MWKGSSWLLSGQSSRRGQPVRKYMTDTTSGVAMAGSSVPGVSPRGFLFICIPNESWALFSVKGKKGEGKKGNLCAGSPVFSRVGL